MGVRLLVVKIKKTEDAKDIPLPTYASDGSAGLDIYACVDDEVVINPKEIKLIRSGILMELPPGYEAQIRPRSGLALKYGIGILNSPGTIDSDYRGEIGIILINLGDKPFTIRRGDRIAQMVITRYEKVEIQEVNVLAQTQRAEGGFGSTGI